jgi:hypothetical protein
MDQFVICVEARTCFHQERSYVLLSGSVDPDDFFKISDKLLFIMKPTLTAQ